MSLNVIDRIRDFGAHPGQVQADAWGYLGNDRYRQGTVVFVHHVEDTIAEVNVHKDFAPQQAWDNPRGRSGIPVLDLVAVRSGIAHPGDLLVATQAITVEGQHVPAGSTATVRSLDPPFSITIESEQWGTRVLRAGSLPESVLAVIPAPPVQATPEVFEPSFGDVTYDEVERALRAYVRSNVPFGGERHVDAFMATLRTPRRVEVTVTVAIDASTVDEARDRILSAAAEGGFTDVSFVSGVVVGQ
jgi:hypothetical protein